MRAAPPQSYALHRRRLFSCAPLLLKATLCIVVGAAHAAFNKQKVNTFTSCEILSALTAQSTPMPQLMLSRRGLILIRKSAIY
jgi:hypothetical protein